MGVGVAFGLGIGRAQKQFGPHDRYLVGVGHGQLIHAIPQFKCHAQPAVESPLIIRANLANRRPMLV